MAEKYAPTPEEEEYTMQKALDEATTLLVHQFGKDKVEQSAAVQLATFLYGAHARDEFLRRQHESEISYGGPPSSY